MDVRLAIRYRVLILVFKWSVWDSKEGHWANGVCILNKVIKFSGMDTTLSQGKVAAILDRIEGWWRRFEGGNR
jgi:hypothetical protein